MPVLRGSGVRSRSRRMLMEDVKKQTTPKQDLGFRPGRPTFGWLGFLLIPIALLAYLIALPFFGLFWLIEWFLPLQSEPNEAPHGARALPALHSPTEESPTH